jgi:hypothetical protein
MSAIAPAHRYVADRETVHAAHLTYGLVMAYAYSTKNPTIPTLRILDPAVSRPDSFRSLSSTHFDAWWELLESICGPTGEPLLCVVGDVTEPRRFGIAYTPAGKEWARNMKAWERAAVG